MGLKSFLFGGDATKGLETKGANYDFGQSYLRQQLGGVDGRQAPQAQAYQFGPAAQLAGGPQDQVRQQQMDQSSYLRGIMGGQQAGAGEMAVNRQVGQAQAQQQAMARMARGGSAALAARGAARAAADIGLAGAGQAAQAQLQDQQAASGQLGALLGQIRGQDLDMAGQNAQMQQQQMLMQGQFGQQANVQNAQMLQQQMQMDDAARQSYLAQLLGMDQQTFANEMQKRGLAAQDKGAFGGLMSAAGGALATYASGGFGGGPLFGAPRTAPLNATGLRQPGTY